jgi:hypothetical protein
VAAFLGASLATWVAVVATIATALTTHVAAGRYEFQLMELLRTAERLDQLAAEADPADPDAMAELAVKAEEVISIEKRAGWPSWPRIRSPTRRRETDRLSSIDPTGVR